MATRHKSALKRHRQNVKRRGRNRGARSSVRSAVKAAREAIAGKDKKAIPEAIRAAEGALRNAASRGVIAKRSASRLVSRLAKAAWKS